MNPLRRLSTIEQTARHLREGLRTGQWGERLPGVARLAVECNVSKVSLRGALRILEGEGLLAPDGNNGRTILRSGRGGKGRRTMRVGVLLNEPLVEENASMQRTLLNLQSGIVAAGHECFFSAKSQTCLRHDTRRIARFVRATPADAWVVLGGPKELLTWFSEQPVPCLALGGRHSEVPIAAASTNFVACVSAATRSIADLGHRRIVMVCPAPWRKPVPGIVAQAFNAELAAHGITPGEYHTPDWDETPEGLQTLLEALFKVTPPTALLTVEPAHAAAALAFIAQRGIRIGRDLSFICMIDDPTFTWRRPRIAHFDWQSDLLIRRIVRWVGATARGRVDREQWLAPVTFVPGGTIMAPPKG